MFKNIFKNKDLIVFWTAMMIAACDLLPLERLTIPEVTAAPPDFGSQVISMNERPGLERQEYVRDRVSADQKSGSNDGAVNSGMTKSTMNTNHRLSGLN